MNVRTLDAAEADLFAAARHLEGERTGTGSRLIREYQEALETVERFPAFNSLVEDEVTGREIRNALLLRQTYRIIYEVRADEVLVVAVEHTHRQLGNWHQRLLDAD